jgi:hypothetical protein
VEDDAIVKAFTGKFLDPLDMAGGQVRAQLNRDVAFGGFEEDLVSGSAMGVPVSCANLQTGY